MINSAYEYLEIAFFGLCVALVCILLVFIGCVGFSAMCAKALLTFDFKWVVE